jgi:hypothetical protein
LNSALVIDQKVTQLTKESKDKSAALVVEEISISYNTYLIQVRKAAL